MLEFEIKVTFERGQTILTVYEMHLGKCSSIRHSGDAARVYIAGNWFTFASCEPEAVKRLAAYDKNLGRLSSSPEDLLAIKTGNEF